MARPDGRESEPEPSIWSPCRVLAAGSTGGVSSKQRRLRPGSGRDAFPAVAIVQLSDCTRRATSTSSPTVTASRTTTTEDHEKEQV
jgi:hypothetical protein